MKFLFYFYNLLKYIKITELIINLIIILIFSNWNYQLSDNSLVVRMDASQAFDPGSSPGYRIQIFFLNVVIIFVNSRNLSRIISIMKK